MHPSDLAAICALGAALFIAFGDVFQQRSAHEVTDEPVGHAGLFLRLLRDRQWWLGSLLAIAGFALQAAALRFGSVLLVEALLVTSILFALPLSKDTEVSFEHLVPDEVDTVFEARWLSPNEAVADGRLVWPELPDIMANAVTAVRGRA